LIQGHTIDSTFRTFVFRSKKATDEQKDDETLLKIKGVIINNIKE